MKKISIIGLFALGLLLMTTSCDEEETVPVVAQVEPEAKNDDEEPMEEAEEMTTSFNVTITNVVNYLNAIVFNTHNAATEPGPIPDAGCFYSIDFKALPPGGKLSFATMSVVSNDWFFAPRAEGISLFENGMPVTGDVTDQVYLWDAGVEEEDPATRTSEPDGATAGAPDDDDSVRIVTTEVSNFIKVYLSYDEATSYFTLKIENVRGNKVETDPIVITPGIIVIHAQDNALFTEGEKDRGLGLAKIAVQGNPSDLHGWFTESGTDGTPLRLSSSFTVLSPGIVYAFNSESDPIFMEGEPMLDGSGIEELAEDGNSGVMYDHIANDLMLPVAKSNEMMPIGPGGSLTFTIEVPEGYKLGYNTMFVFSNDWFLAHGNSGFPLFSEDGTPISGYGATEKTYLYDAGTEVDQTVGMGPDQAPFQSGPNTGAEDDNNLIRRVMEINDMQYGKGTISSPAGVAGHGDPRGGYNLVKVLVEPN
ncbi:spondin domain-containing protein [Maribacter algicola]|uniref:Spondin domain-containing protein n=1 Tax=Meishania litoralis TaxID=3434685 RepID=A0ACC7LKQ2_9FLAO